MKTGMSEMIKRKTVAAAFCAALILGCWMMGEAANAQIPPADLPPGVQDVVKLTKAGINEDVILAQVKNSGATYNLTTDQLIYLSKSGVSQNVIKALIQSAPAPVPTAATPPSGPPPTDIPPPPSSPPPGSLPPDAVPAPNPDGSVASVAPATPPPSYDSFHDQLATYGTWSEVPGYGWCWRPSVAQFDPHWRPYADSGYWMYTENGWYWQSDYPWGGIAFHYGRWTRDGLGWLWIPGYDWAPSWVCWRHADGYIGWAPLPPGAVFRAGVGLEFGGHLALDVDFGLGVDAFTFVGYDHFWDHNLRGFFLPRERADFVFRHSIVMNGYRMDHGRFIVDGFGRDHIALWTHHDIRVEAGFRDGRDFRHEDDRRGFRDDRRDHDRP